jgi:hypothetical protein
MNDTMTTIIKSYSTYVVTVISAVIAYWLQLSPEEQAALIATYPALKVLAPLFGWIAFVIARVIPQNLPGKVEIKVEEKTPLNLDETKTILEAARLLQERTK